MTDRTAYFELIEQSALSGQMTDFQLQECFADDRELKAWFTARAEKRQGERPPQSLTEIIRERDAFRHESFESTYRADMLARRCADQARQIGVLMLQDGRRLTVSTEEVIDALRTRADEDGCIHFDAIREILKQHGARP